MLRIVRYQKPIAAFLLLVFIMQLTAPAAHALTTGPSQPEMKGFEAAGTSDMVDLFSGDFKYNIPLLDVGGYPLNISYQSGSGMDDEASWVGLGWSLNPGSLSRQMRGLPDDFNGTDQVEKEFSVRQDITGGVKFKFSTEAYGVNVAGILNVTPDVGIFYNNQRGLGVEVGFGAGAPLLTGTTHIAGENTANLLKASTRLSLNSQDGVGFDPSLNLSVTSSIKEKSEKDVSASFSVGASISSRTGLTSTTLRGASEVSGKKLSDIRTLDGSCINYAHVSFSPRSNASFYNESYSVTPALGTEAVGIFAGAQITGYYSRQKVAEKFFKLNAYGFLNAHKGNGDSKALMDFNREKEVPYVKEVPNLPIPVATPDLFMATSQGGSQQFRAYASGSGIFFDHDNSNLSVSASAGFEVGVGLGVKSGADVQANVGITTTSKWKNRRHLLSGVDVNPFFENGKFNSTSDVSLFEPTYFKKVGESTPAENSWFKAVGEKEPVRVNTEGNLLTAIAPNSFVSKSGRVKAVTGKLIRNNRDKRNTNISVLSVKEAERFGLNKKVVDYKSFKNTPYFNNCATAPTLSRPSYMKDHHIGEVTVTDESGKRTVYGTPVYNVSQEDASFNISKKARSAEDVQKGLVEYNPQDNSINNQNGVDHFYSKEKMPSYAHSFLLSGILSPDYVDVTGDGISDDDRGSFVKFNYQRHTDNFQWRTPFVGNFTSTGNNVGKANFSEGLKGDDNDNKANYSYGKKELWYQHSIESKTMVALFILGDRADALGCDVNGKRDNAIKQQYLKRIELYSKAELLNPTIAGKPEPIKTVNFVYDYSLCTGVPNNDGSFTTGDPNVSANQGGKLTLKKIYFTYALNDKGKLNPYEFVYNAGKSYGYKKYDRWGNYKDETNNPGSISNDDYTYSTQNKATADANASLWQITKVITPAGGAMEIVYESDDYAYVQNRRATRMFKLGGIGSYGKETDYYKDNLLYVDLDEAVTSDQELIAKYFDGFSNEYNRKLFFKALVHLNDKGKHQDYVSGYADIESVRLMPGRNNVAEITVKRINGDGKINNSFYNPIAKAAWQYMRINLPQYVYSGYNVREDLGPVQFVKALIGAIKSVSEILAPFDTRAVLAGLANRVDVKKSWVRLCSPSSKLGGGCRVKRLIMNDDWSRMTKSVSATASYGQEYDYSTTTTLSNGQSLTISSGVASYEPMIGAEENPFRVPIEYQQKVKFGPDNLYFIEEPLCESYFPGPSVGYSKVAVRNIGADGSVGQNGYTESEFYTAKDFPTMVAQTPISSEKFGGVGILKLLQIKRNSSRVVSQGYTVEVNDMHGKPKSEKVVDKADKELSSVFYYYKVFNENTPEKRLNNESTVLLSDGTASSTVIGRDMEVFHDMREQTTTNYGVNVMINLDIVYLIFAALPVPTVLPLPNLSYSGFRSSATIKVFHQYGLLDRVVKTQNGSRIETQNLAWDAETGQVLLTRTQNEYDDPVFNFSYPAHWTYEKGMGMAYKNIGLTITGLSSNSSGVISSSEAPLLLAGDELITEGASPQKYWINETEGTSPVKVIIDADGKVVSLNNITVKIIRSGRRNMHSIPVGNLVSLKNPIQNGKIDVSTFTQVINAGGSVYRDDWGVSAANLQKDEMVCPEGYSLDVKGRCFKDEPAVVDPTYNVNTLITKVTNSVYSTCGSLLNSSASAWNTLSSGAEPSGTITLPAAGLWKNGTASSCVNSVVGGSTEADGPLNRCGVWITQQNSTNYRNEWVGFKTKVYFESVATRYKTGTNGNYFLGFGGDNSIEVYINNVLVAARLNSTTASATAYRFWRIKPITIPLDRQSEIYVRVRNETTDNPNPASLGVEIYNNNLSELQNAGCLEQTCLPCNLCSACRVAAAVPPPPCNYATVVWSSSCMVGKRMTHYSNNEGTTLKTDFDPVCTGGTVFTDATTCAVKCSTTQRIYADKIPKTTCTPPAGQIINPYFKGVKGNWRVDKAFVYHADRASVPPRVVSPNTVPTEATNIRKSGAYSLFSPFWKYENGVWKHQDADNTSKIQATIDANWVWSNQMTRFNNKGDEVENRDALNRYSSAQFGYLESIPVAVASNARSNEIAFDGFEDYRFKLDCGALPNNCNLDGYFSVQRLLKNYPSQMTISSEFAHSGRNSFKVEGSNPAEVTQNIYVAPSALNKYLFDASNQVLMQQAGVLPVFSPDGTKKYVLNAWIKGDVDLDGASSTKAAIEVYNNSTTRIANTVKSGPLVEGWRKVEAVFTIPAGTTSIRIKFRPASSGVTYFDDMRVHPYDAQMKSFAYDNKSMRLWAELDENNFATFYEYDDEGILIRVKKETEKGIMTIKETRSMLKTK